MGINKGKRLTMFRQILQFFPSRDTDDQRILEFEWLKDTPGHIHPRVVV